MEIGVVLPVFDQEPQYIYECIDSIERQNLMEYRLDGKFSYTTHSKEEIERKSDKLRKSVVVDDR